jgi:putative oxidoreductase
MVASTELVGGALLLLGLWSRFASAALIVLLCGAYYTADRDAVHALFTDPDKFFAADPFLFLYASVIVFCFGPGWLALDTLIYRKKVP